MAGTLAGAAGLTASWSAVAASHYARLLATGACPDGQTLWQALAGASREIRGCIIRFQWQRGARVLTSPVFWLGVGIGLGLGLHPGPFVQRAGMALCCWLLLLLGNIDGRTGLLPDALTLPMVWLGLAAAWLQAGSISLEKAVAGAFVGYAVPAGMRGLWRWWRQLDALGRGDVKLLAGIGVWLGPHDVLLVLLCACLAAIVWVGWRYRRLALQAVYPFGPFLSGSAIVWLLWPGM